MDVKKLVSQMTLEEKCGLCSGDDFWHTKAVERLGIPRIMVSDGPHGLRKQNDKGDHLGFNDSIKAVCFPAGCAAASSFDRSLFERLASALGDECLAERVAVLLGPAINIKRSPLCGRNFEYLSEDPYLAGELAAAYTASIQKKNVGVSVKHFACNNQEKRRQSSSSNIDERTMREIYLTPFETTVRKSKPWTVMASYNRINGVFATENKWLLTDVLRKEWGFDGFVVSDWGAVSDRVAGLKAGMDLEMPSSNGVYDKEILEAVKNGTLDEKILDTACERILNIAYKAIENYSDNDKWDMEGHHELAGQLASESMVLLKNDDNILPLNKSKKIAFIGEYAAKPRIQGGGSSHINCFKITSVLDAVKDFAEVTYAKGFYSDNKNADKVDQTLIDEAVKAASQADTVVVFAGLPDVYESEGYDRSHMHLPEVQNMLINEILKVNKNVVVVLHNGSPVELPWADKVKGILEAYLCGQNTGTAEKNILFGLTNPSGRLAETFPLKMEDNPSFLFYGGEECTNYNEGIFVGYRYYDKKKMNVLYPFGHGLSYTTFEYSDLKVSASKIKDTETVTVSVNVKNTGAMDGKEVVQLYVSDRESTVQKAVRELKGFEKIDLKAGETKTVTFTLDKRAFAYWEKDLPGWYVESGIYDIQICKNSRDVLLTAEIEVEGTDVIRYHYDINSINADIVKTEKGRRALKEFGALTSGEMFAGGDNPEANEAISKEMQEAMFKDAPLRSMISFSGGKVTKAQLQELINKLNQQD